MLIRLDANLTLMLVWIQYIFVTTKGQLHSPISKTIIPRYYIDPKILKILGSRQECFQHRHTNLSSNALEELQILRSQSATEYYRGHELLAHHFFVEQRHVNPHYAKNYEEAEFEHIPLLPLSWVAKPYKYRVSLSSVDNFSNYPSNFNRQCSYSALIKQILEVQHYLQERDKRRTESNSGVQHKTDTIGSDNIRPVVIPKFAVASAFNLRTQLGSGMPSQVRKGEAWQSVMAFVMSLSIGHYERYPQCPDLLRKSWKYIVELPYLAIQTSIQSPPSTTTTTTTGSSGSPSIGLQMKRSRDSMILRSDRQHMFFFSGNFALYGPEMVCSVRNAVLNINTRRDLLLLNTTINDHNRGVDERISEYLSNSVFCLITKSDSYSTSLLYHALRAGCIPVVISDWFTFAFPWLIPYQQFVLRIQELDFLKNANLALDYIRDNYGKNAQILHKMRENIRKSIELLVFEPTEYQSAAYHRSLQHDVYFNRNHNHHTTKEEEEAAGAMTSQQSSFQTYLPLEAMLLELRYAQYAHQYYNNVPCMRPYMCAHDHINATTMFRPTTTGTDAPTLSGTTTTGSSSKSSSGGGASKQSKNKKDDAPPAFEYIFPGDTKDKFHYLLLPSTTTSTVTIPSGPTSANAIDTTTATDTSTVPVLPVDASAPLVPLPPNVKRRNDGYQVRSLVLPITFQEDLRSHLCRHSMRLIGSYKIVFWMQCVRILWPLHAGHFRYVDNVERFTTPTVGGNNTPAEEPKLREKHLYQVDPYGISRTDRDFVRYFLGVAEKPPGWEDAFTNYPEVVNKSGVVTLH